MKLKIRLVFKVLHISLLFVSGLIIAGIIFPILAVLHKPVLVKHKRDALKLAWLKWFSSILGLQVKPVGKPFDHPCLVVSNHISWLDIIVLGCFKPAHFVAKSDILAWPVIGYLAKQGGTVFIRRGNKQQTLLMAETLAWLLKQNSTVILFPEGTTTAGEEVLTFHTSLFQSAVLTKSTIQPVAINYLGKARAVAPFIGDDDFVSHLIKILMLEKIEVRIDFHRPISAAGKDRQSVSNEARAMISESVTGRRLDVAI
jgi:lyso-ornithine lipid O-acyltransferase